MYETKNKYSAPACCIEAVKIENVDTQFTYSDHNPVVLKFMLK